MKRAFFISCGVHTFAIFAMWVASLFGAPFKVPQKVYSVRIMPAPKRPDVVRSEEKTTAEEKKKPEVEKPKTIAEPKDDKKNSDKAKPKSAQQDKTEQKSQKQFAQGNASVMIDGPMFSDDFYLNLVMTKIGNNWMNPLRGGRKISVLIYFRIKRNGDVSDLKVKTSSGNAIFDQAAMRAVMEAMPLPPLPESYTGDFLGITFEFEHTAT